MQGFRRLEGVAAPIDLPNVDTDRIIPARFLRKARGPDYARFLFHDVRFDAEGRERLEFVLNQVRYREATILVAAENFGCGSSREMAVWALVEFGIRVVIAPSLGDIFRQNCVKNGVLPILLAAEVCAGLRQALHASPGARIVADLESQSVTAPGGETHPFQIDAFHREMLLSGRDETELTLGHRREIESFEARQRIERPWIVPPPAV